MFGYKGLFGEDNGEGGFWCCYVNIREYCEYKFVVGGWVVDCGDDRFGDGKKIWEEFWCFFSDWFF